MLINVTNLTVEKNHIFASYRLARYIVKHEGRIVGFLEKFPNDRSTRHPWKAWSALEGSYHHYLGCSYEGRTAALGLLASFLSAPAKMPHLPV